MAIMYLSNDNFTCLKELIIMHKELSSYADTMHKLFKNSMKPDTNSIKNSVDPTQLIRSHSFFIQHGILSS